MEERGRAERGTVAEHLVRIRALLEQAGGLGLLVGGRLGVPASALVSENRHVVRHKGSARAA
jgi:hypothetical protein